MDITSSYLSTQILKALPDIDRETFRIIGNVLDSELADCTIEKQTFELMEVNTNLRYVEEYYSDLKMSNKSENTIKQYLNALKNFVAWYQQDLTKITYRDLKKYYMHYASTRQVSARSLLNIERFISPFFTFMLKCGYMEHNPALLVEKPKYQQAVIDALTSEEIEIIKCSLKKDEYHIRNRALIEFLLATGCGVSEVSACKLNDVDFSNKLVRVTGKGNKTRIVYFNGTCAKYLKDYIKTRTDSSEYLFLSKYNNRWTKNSIEKLCSSIENNTGIHCNPHKFRHTFAQTCVDRGMTVENLSKLMGHSSIATTQKYFNVNQSSLGNEYRKYCS